MERDRVGDRISLARPGRMADDPLLLVERDDPLVFVDDVDGNVARYHIAGRRRREHELNHVVGVRLVTGLGGHPVDRDLPALDESLKNRTRNSRIAVVQKAIKPPAHHAPANA